MKFDGNREEASYLIRKVYSYTTACVLYHTYLNVYLTLRQSGYSVPSEEVFLQHAKKFKKKQIEYVEAIPGEQFVPNPDFRSQYFSLFNYYNMLVNFYGEDLNKDLNKFIHFLNKMMDAKEDFNILSANWAIFEKINESLASTQDLRHHLLLLSLGLKVIDNRFNYYKNLNEESRQDTQFVEDWLYQGIKNVELEALDLPSIRQEYYSRYVATVLMLATEQANSLEVLAKKTKLNLFIEKIAVQVHSSTENFDVHDVYAEVDLVVNERFISIIIEQLERINVPFRFSDNSTISIEASFLEIHTQSLKQAFLQAKRFCSDVEKKRLDQLKKEENDKILATEQLKKEEHQLEQKEEVTKKEEPKMDESEKVDEKKEKKKAEVAHQHEKKSKTKRIEKEKKTEFSKQGSFFNPRQPKSVLPPFKTLPEGVRVHKLRKSDSPCKYWVCIHPCLVGEMTREHKTLELNRLHNQLREGALGKGQGVRGIIEGKTIKWADPSRNCRYFGLAAEEYHDHSGKHVLFMLTTKVDEHSKKTPNIIVPPELKEKEGKKLTMG